MPQHYGLNLTIAHSLTSTVLSRFVGRGTFFSLNPKQWQQPPSTKTRYKDLANRMSRMGRSALLCGCFSVGVVLSATLSTYSAESRKSTHSNTAPNPSNPPLPPDLGAPKGRTGGGASRGTCTESQAMRAVLPRNSNRAYDLTVSARPTLWFYLPDRPHPNTQLEFVLQDAADRYVYKTTFVQPNPHAGLLSLTVPEESSPLKAGAIYSWTLSIQCNPSHPSQISFVRGAIQRVAVEPFQAIAPNLSTTLVLPDRAVVAKLYAQQGYWSDAITILAEALQSQPRNQPATQLWKDLLTRSGITDLLPPPSIAIRKSKAIEISPTAVMP
jgi:Domain of Unknown Function (DUF928)